jgi:hypothetical protein
LSIPENMTHSAVIATAQPKQSGIRRGALLDGFALFMPFRVLAMTAECYENMLVKASCFLKTALVKRRGVRVAHIRQARRT